MAILSLGKMMSGSKRSTGKSGRGSSMNFTKRIDPGRMLRRSLSGARSRFVGNIGSGDMGYQAISKGYRLTRGLARGLGLGKKEKENSATSSVRGDPVRSTTSLENFKNFKIVVFRKLDTIIDLLGKLQLSKPIAPPPSPAELPVEEGAPEKDKPLNLGFLAGLLSSLAMKYFIAPLVRIFKNIIGMITRLWNGLKRLFMSVVNKIKSIFRSLWRMVTAVKNLFVRLVKFIAGLIPKIAGALKEIGKSIGKFFKDAFRAAKDYIIKRLLGVKNFIEKMAARALSSLGKMLLKLVPGAGALAALLKNNPRAARALEAARRAQSGVAHVDDLQRAAAAATRAAEQKAFAEAWKAMSPEERVAHAAKGTGSGMRLLKQFVPGVGSLIGAGLAIYDIMQADEEFAKDKDRKKHDRAVGVAIVGAVGATAGGAAGALVVGTGMAMLGSVVPLFGTAVGGLIGALVGGVGGAIFGEQLLLGAIDRFGGVDALGEYINRLREPESAKSLKETEAQLDIVKDPALSPEHRLEAYGNVVFHAQNLLKTRIINEEEHKKLVAEAKRLGKIKSTGTEKVPDPAPTTTPAPTTPDPASGTPVITPVASAVTPVVTPAATPTTTPTTTPAAAPAPAPEPQPPQQQASAVQPVPPAPTPESQNASNVVINRQTNVSQNNTVIPVFAAPRAVSISSPFYP